MARPKGSRNLDRDYVDVELSRCVKCGSTDRDEYTNTTTQNYPGIRDGRPYTSIVRRNTKCKTCGQARVDRVYEYVPTELDSAK